MQASIIRRPHEVGHFAVGKTESLIKRDYWFANMKPKIDKVVGNCVNCILAERKHGKREGSLHSVEKGEIPLDTYHIDHLGPLVSTKKSYKHILLVIDGFTKFTWLYATRSTTTAEVIDKLQKQSVIFGNPRRIISDRGTAFTSCEFEDYCVAEQIKHVTITTGMPRSNGQAERINRVLIPILTKLAAPHPEEWYKHLDRCQKFLNITVSRSTGMTPFRVMFGVDMRLQDDLPLKELLEREWTASFDEIKKVGDHDGPKESSTSAEYMKVWIHDSDSDQSDEENAQDI
ncbi:Pro-Pol polyprotein [Anthophora quadrimaculata]